MHFGISTIVAVEESVRFVELTRQSGSSPDLMSVATHSSLQKWVVWRIKLVRYLGDRGAQQPREHPSLLGVRVFAHMVVSQGSCTAQCGCATTR